MLEFNRYSEPVADAQLLQLSEPPPEVLIPQLRQTDQMRPLVWLLVLLPAFGILDNAWLTDAAAEQSLASLQLSASDSIADWLEPGQFTKSDVIKWQSPWTMWLQATSLALLGVNEWARLLPGILGAVWMALGCVFLARRLGGQTLALVLAAILAFNGQVSSIACLSSANMWTCGAATFAVWAFFEVRDGQGELRRWPIVFSGLCVGLALFVGGPWGLAVLGTLLVWSLVARKLLPPDLDDGFAPPCAISSDFLRVAAIGVPLGMWWAVWMGFRFGTDFWSWWWAWPRGGTALLTMSGGSAVRAMSPLWGAAAGGLVAILIDHRRQTSRPKLVALVALIGISALTWGLSETLRASGSAFLWPGLFLTAGWLLAALCLSDLVERRLPFWLGLICLGGLVFEGGLPLLSQRMWESRLISLTSRAQIMLFYLLILVVFASILALVGRWARHGDRRQRLTLGVLLSAALVSMTVFAQRGESPQQAISAQEIARLVRGLRSVGQPNRVQLLVRDTPRGLTRAAPATLRWLIHSTWPNARLQDGAIIPTAGSPSPRVQDIILTWGRRDDSRPAENYAPRRSDLVLGGELLSWTQEHGSGGFDD